MTISRKTLSLDNLLAFRSDARQAGRTVVHCHGCFDIVHPGHIQHLQYARSLGDALVVSVSADTHVNKGVDRPLIPDDLRAASLAALECVDAVYINPDPTAVELLETLRPDVYVKGKEYETSVDRRFLAEREAVERHGGRVVFSSGEVVYSSTALISTLERSDRFQQEKLARLRARHQLSDFSLRQTLTACRGLRVVVVGDYLLDHYHFCDATGVAGEGPMLSLRELQQKQYDGGAGVIALHLAGLGARPTLVTALADDEESRQAEFRLRSAGVEVLSLPCRPSLVAKHRYLVDQTKLFKVDHGAAAPLDSRQTHEAAELIRSAADGAAAVVFADFGAGFLTAGLLSQVLPALRKTVPILTADASGHQGNLLRFHEVDLLCPTEREARAAHHDFSSGLGAVAWKLLDATKARHAIITLGKQGLVTFDRDDQPASDRLRSEYIPSLCGHAIDPLGCGDALLATATLALAAGSSLHAAAYLGAVAAAVEAKSLGNTPINADQITAALGADDVMSIAA